MNKYKLVLNVGRCLWLETRDYLSDKCKEWFDLEFKEGNGVSERRFEVRGEHSHLLQVERDIRDKQHKRELEHAK